MSEAYTLGTRGALYVACCEACGGEITASPSRVAVVERAEKHVIKCGRRRKTYSYPGTKIDLTTEYDHGEVIEVVKGVWVTTCSKCEKEVRGYSKDKTRARVQFHYDVQHSDRDMGIGVAVHDVLIGKIEPRPEHPPY